MGANSTDNDGYLPVFDTCEVVRRKIRNFLNKFALSKTAFLRTVSKDVINCPDFQVGQLNRFLAMKVPRKGNTCGVHYAAYVFFEQRRIQDRQPKSAERIEMERLYPYDAADLCLNLPPRILIETANWRIERTKPKQEPGVGGKSASVKVPDVRTSVK
ncbi:hypothetical protein G3M48_001305 [Beauveria asiatica]|uniref:DUF7726 domain-containing protein n=1 Tax=Beauveria asiatica TaxID=1069075 RepID=A0AAW0RG04_9HYPO